MTSRHPLPVLPSARSLRQRVLNAKRAAIARGVEVLDRPTVQRPVLRPALLQELARRDPRFASAVDALAQSAVKRQRRNTRDRARRRMKKGGVPR